MSAVRAVTEATFAAEVLSNDKPVVVDFWATWCGPCRQLAPVLDQLATEYADKIDVVKVDLDANPALGQRYGVQSVPTLVVIEDGEMVQQIVGAKPKAALVSALSSVL